MSNIENNNNINNKKIFTSLFTVTKGKKDGDGRLNQRYFKQINKENNWIDSNPYLPPFWGWLLYSLFYMFILINIIFYIGVLGFTDENTDAPINLDKQ